MLVRLSPSAGILSRYDFEKELQRKDGLRIYPYSSVCQQSASYDLTPTIIALSSKTGLLEKVYRKSRPVEDYFYIIVRPKDTVLIVSNEYLLVPPDIAGYVSSRVSKVVEGFGHISTTIDPNWTGAALIAVSNPSNKPLKIRVGSSVRDTTPPNPLATVTFHYLSTPCNVKDKAPTHVGMRLDLLEKIQYANRKGLRVSLRALFLRRQRKFTDYFFSASRSLQQDFTPQRWDTFLQDFSYLTASPPDEAKFSSRESQKTARNFVVTENLLIRVCYFISRHKPWFLLLLGLLLFVLYQWFPFPQSLQNAIETLFPLLIKTS